MTALRVSGLLAAGAAAVVALLVILGGSARETAAPAPRSIERSIGLFDAHLHLSVADVRVVTTPAGAATRPETGKRLWIVTVRARNDAARIDIDPSSLDVAVLSREGRTFAPLEGADRPAEAPLSTRLDGTLRPGDSIQRSFVFELPDDALAPVLVIESHDAPLPWLPRGIVRWLGGRVELGLS